MSPEALFQIANPLALAGWIILVLSPFAPRAADLLAGYVIPALLSAGYAALILAHFATAEGGYGSLPEVMRLFDFPGVALAGWVHYLAFDLFVGAWEGRVRPRRADAALAPPALPGADVPVRPGGASPLPRPPHRPFPLPPDP